MGAHCLFVDEPVRARASEARVAIHQPHARVRRGHQICGVFDGQVEHTRLVQVLGQRLGNLAQGALTTKRYPRIKLVLFLDQHARLFVTYRRIGWELTSVAEVRLLDGHVGDNAGAAARAALDRERSETVSLRNVERERVAVIGGGVTGALSAARLAERGFQVVLLEKAAIGNGSSSRSMAGIRAQFGVEETVIGMLYSEWWYAHFHEMLSTPVEHQQPAIRQNGYLFLYDHPDAPDAAPDAAANWEHAQRVVAMQHRAGVPVELLARADVAKRWPHLVAERLIGATWCPTDGFLFPAVIYGEGIRRAQELGTRILQRTEVVGAQHVGTRIVALNTSGGTLETDWVVNCTNAWAARVSPRLGGMQLPISPVKRFLYHLDPGGAAMPPEALRTLPMTIYGMGRRLGAHTRPDGQHLILAGTSHTPPEPEFEDDDQDVIPAHFDHRHGVANFGFELLADMALYAPTLVESGGLVATTCGYYGMTPDAVPMIGLDAEVRNLVHAAGFSGHGVMHAPVTALLVEEILTGAAHDGRVRLPPPFDNHSLDLAAFDPIRDFTRSSPETAVL